MEITLQGPQYEIFSKSVYTSRFTHKGKIGSLTNWKQSLVFEGKTDLLVQFKSGPCGFLACLQAQIINYRRNPDFEHFPVQTLLFYSINNILRIICGKYVFCQSYNDGNKIAKFIIFNHPEDSINYLESNDFSKHPEALLLLAVSFIFAADGLDKLEVPEAPFIAPSQYTEMTLVWTMLIGPLSEELISQMEHGNYSMLPQHEIGLRVINGSIQVNGTHFNSSASVFVIHNQNHFFSILKLRDSSIVYDTLNHKNGPFAIENSVIFS